MNTNNPWDAQTYDQRHGFVARYGEDLLPLLNAQSGERILDLGCGTGSLTAQIAATGATIIGLDASPEMLARARAEHPDIEFEEGNARHFSFPEPFDAVFSNAALHWIPEAGEVIASVAENLNPGGRFVAEMGGQGNVAALHRALAEAARAQNAPDFGVERHFFPSPAVYATLLEEHGFEVRMITLFDRPTPLAGSDGAKNWLQQFCAFYLEILPSELAEAVLNEAQERLRPILHGENGWFADYRRLRFVAVVK